MPEVPLPDGALPPPRPPEPVAPPGLPLPLVPVAELPEPGVPVPPAGAAGVVVVLGGMMPLSVLPGALGLVPAGGVVGRMVVPVPPRGMLPGPVAGGLVDGVPTRPAGGAAGVPVLGVAGWAGGKGCADVGGSGGWPVPYGGLVWDGLVCAATGATSAVANAATAETAGITSRVLIGTSLHGLMPEQWHLST